jgi:hypothetical protein
MSKRLVYMVVDTETATLPFANDIAENSEAKKNIAIAKPLVYDIGWTLMYRDGTVFEKKQFLVTETFSVPAVFNTAYYASKRPLYLAMMERGEIECLPWNTIMEAFIADLEKCDYVGAFNSMFDFKKAIPFTELYINKLYSADYEAWEKMQYKLCERIANNQKEEKKWGKEFDSEHFSFRGKHYELFDIWGMACEHLLNRPTYKNMCLDLGMLTNSGEFFKTSAEASYRFLREWYDFEEAHTALADVEIECFILSKILSRHAVTVGLEYFPFRKLGYTDDYVLGKNHPNQKHMQTVFDAMEQYVGDDWEFERELTKYQQKIVNKMRKLREEMGL